mmetsp:Transcript_17726/g.25889  ORF Transcript_17726/g.25889 Transcript_17726/m.25889 type:complete len:99 (+) Transcript_17726:259-555(+)
MNNEYKYSVFNFLEEHRKSSHPDDFVVFDGIKTDIPHSFCDAIRDMGAEVRLKWIKKAILDIMRIGSKDMDCDMMLAVLKDLLWELGFDNPEEEVQSW